MKTDDEIRRLRRIIVGFSMVLIIILCGIALYASIEVRNLKNQVQLLSDKKPTIIHGIDGKNGVAGLPGLGIMGPAGPAGTNGTNGINGQNGQSVTLDDLTKTVASWFQANPVTGKPGPKGVKGNDGLTLQIQVDLDTCKLEEKYTTDDIWTPIAQLPSPCSIDESPQ